MIAESISYKNFRNIKNAKIDFKNGVNILLGNNAEGKTNALEGIYLMASGKSFRTQKERDLVKFEEPFFEVTLKSKDSEREKELYFKAFSSQYNKKRECKKNGSSISVTELIGEFRAVLFCPEHLSIVKDGPSERRNFLDIALCQLKPVYLKSLKRFNKILSERNALLKQLSENFGDKSLLEIYSDQLAKESAFIFKTRMEYILKLDYYVKQIFEEFSYKTGKEEIAELSYKNSLKTTEKISEKEAYELYMKRLCENINGEIGAGITLYGSHKDDIEISIGKKEARQFASQGQQRYLSLALKLAEGEISKEYSGEYPVFLFDDVLSELDEKRQEFLLSSLNDRQVIMTTCTMPKIKGDINIINVEKGNYKCTFTPEIIL